MIMVRQLSKISESSSHLSYSLYYPYEYHHPFPDTLTIADLKNAGLSFDLALGSFNRS